MNKLLQSALLAVPAVLPAFAQPNDAPMYSDPKVRAEMEAMGIEPAVLIEVRDAQGQYHQLSYWQWLDYREFQNEEHPYEAYLKSQFDKAKPIPPDAQPVPMPYLVPDAVPVPMPSFDSVDDLFPPGPEEDGEFRPIVPRDFGCGPAPEAYNFENGWWIWVPADNRPTPRKAEGTHGDF